MFDAKRSVSLGDDGYNVEARLFHDVESEYVLLRRANEIFDFPAGDGFLWVLEVVGASCLHFHDYEEFIVLCYDVEFLFS